MEAAARIGEDGAEDEATLKMQVRPFLGRDRDIQRETLYNTNLAEPGNENRRVVSTVRAGGRAFTVNFDQV